MTVLDDTNIATRLGSLSGWTWLGDEITKTFECGDFVGSVKFVDDVVGPAEEMNHHPDVTISWDKVTLTLSTHSEGGLTENDFVLAAKIDALA